MKTRHWSGIFGPAGRRDRRRRPSHAFRPPALVSMEPRVVPTGLMPAAFTYTTSVTPTINPFGLSSQVVFTDLAPANSLQGDQNIGLTVVSVQTSTSFRKSDTGTVPYTITLAINETGGTFNQGSIVVTGYLTIDRSDTKGEASSNTVTSISAPVTVNTDTYAVSDVTYSPGVVNATMPPSAGSIGCYLTVTPSDHVTSLALSPGYWKNHTAAANQALGLAFAQAGIGLTPDMNAVTVGQVFSGIDPALAGQTLQSILENPGAKLKGVAGQENVLLYQSIAGLLNAGAASLPGSGILFPYQASQVIQATNAAVAALTGGNDATLLNALHDELNLLNGGFGEGTLSSYFDGTVNHKK